MTPAVGALREFQHRQRLARQAIASGEWTLTTAEERLRPWAAIAILAGADLPEANEALSALASGLITSFADMPRDRAERLARSMLADDLAPPAVWEAVLMRVRNAALNALTGAEEPDSTPVTRGRALARLADALGIAPWIPEASGETDPATVEKAA